MTAHRAVANAVARFFAAVDERDWDRVCASMTAPIHVDYASFGGGDPADCAPEDVVAGWRRILPGFDHTHHQLGNLDVEVDDGAATVSAYGTATHVIDDQVWTVVGRYAMALVRNDGQWRVSRLRFLFKYQGGAKSLPEKASA